MNPLVWVDRLACKWIDWRTGAAVGKLPEEMRAVEFRKIEMDGNGSNILLHAPGIVFLADQAAALLSAENAKNYVEFDMMPRIDRGKRPIRVTVQWASGESPAQKATRLEEQLAAAKSGKCQ